MRKKLVEDFFRQFVQNGFSGAVLVAQDDKILFERGFGHTQGNEGSLITSETVFDVGSISKQFTAACILRLEQENLLKTKDTLDVFFDNVPADKRKITIHHLLTHSAGFIEDHFEDDLTPLDKGNAIHNIFNMPLGFQPGSKYAYSNTGYSLLAAIVEKISGGKFTSYTKKTFFTPLEMSSTGFYNDTHWDSHSIAHGFFNGQDHGKPSTWPGPYWGVMGNGGIMSTVKDMHLWWKSLSKNTILTPEQTEKLFTRHISEGGRSYYGYGWSLWDSGLGPVISHNGGGIGGNSEISVYPDNNIIIIILSNKIVLKMGEDGNPTEIHLPATEAREQLEKNITP